MKVLLAGIALAFAAVFLVRVAKVLCAVGQTEHIITLAIGIVALLAYWVFIGE